MFVMKALLLAGGMGSRLLPLTGQYPKPMAPVGNRPWLEHLITQLRDQGFREIVIALKHYPELVRGYFGSGRKWGVSIDYTLEKEALGTAGAIKHAESKLGNSFIVLNADVVQELDLKPLVDFHAGHGQAVTIGLTEVEDPSQFGVVELAEGQRIVRFVEKPRKEEAPSRLINAGIYVMNKEALQLIPAGREVSIEREVFPKLIRTGMGVYGYQLKGYWLDMGTRARYRQVHWDVLDRKLPIPIYGEEIRPGVWVGRQCRISSRATIVPPVLIGDKVRIEDGVTIRPYSVIGNGCIIKEQAELSETILWEGCRVESGAQLHQCVFGTGAEAGPNYALYEAVVNRMKEAVSL